MTTSKTRPTAEEKMTQDEREIVEIRETELARQHALTSLDLAALEWILADDLIHIHSSGMVHDKSQFLSHVQRMGGFRSIERGALDIRVAGNIAIVAGPTTNGVRSPETGEDVTLKGFSTLVLRKGLRGWQVILSQLTLFRESHGKRS